MNHKHATAEAIENDIRKTLTDAETVNAADIADALTERFCPDCLSEFIGRHGGCCLGCAVDDFLTLEGWE